MRNLIMLPLALIGLLVIDLIRLVRGDPTVEEEWHTDYVDSNLNHGQGKEFND